MRVGKYCFALGDFSTHFVWSKWRSPKKTSSQPYSCHSEGLKKPEESPGKVVHPCKNTRPSTVISSIVERSPKLWYEQWKTKKHLLSPPQCPLGQFMERSENSWRSQFMMPSINSFYKKRTVISTKWNAWRNPLMRSSTNNDNFPP